MEEIWKDVAGTDGRYQVSNLGRARSFLCRNGIGIKEIPHLLRTHFSARYDYFIVSIKGIVRQHKLIHSTVLESFESKRPDGFQCAHLDGNKRNNCLTNLKWVTPKENTSHRIIHGTHGIGVKNPRATITEICAQAILDKLDKTWKVTKIANYYSIKHNIVSRIKHGHAWKHIKE